ncbi:MAG: hypothetical protein JO193_09510 [Candidatus Eremiobacteraeota bacterium]|nr:hypothetical protein [Candidatus Eremiobacteraeota bacterium]
MKLNARKNLYFVVAALPLAAALCSCSGGGGSSSPGSVPPAPQTQSPIQHIVVIIQENRSFDNLFSGFPGANSATSGTAHDGRTVQLHSVNLEDGNDLGHSRRDFLYSYNHGAMNGFDLNVSFPRNVPDYAFAYVNRAEVAPYWAMASAYGLADNLFQSNTGASFVAHQYLIAGQSNMTIDLPLSGNPPQVVIPWGCDSPPGSYMLQFDAQGQVVNGPPPCYSYTSMGDELDHLGVSWKAYAPAFTGPGEDLGVLWSAYDAIKDIRYGPDWSSKVISPETKVLTDIASGNLSTVTWVTPDYLNSDHGRAGSKTGPQWVTSIVNAIGQSPYWPTTAVFIVWDDWGGWYDHVAPPQLDFEGLGFRVPMIVVSPYAKKHYVSHVQHEFGSILHYIESTLRIPSLGATDVRADDLSDFFNYTQPPSSFTPFATTLRASDFLKRRPSMKPPDDE